MYPIVSTPMPDPILTGRNADKLRSLAEKNGIERHTTDLDAALANPDDTIFFDASGTLQRAGFIDSALSKRENISTAKSPLPSNPQRHYC